MPIFGLTNAPESFLKLGQIRKGKKELITKQGKNGPYTVEVPVDLDYFRVTFQPWRMKDGRDGAAVLEQRFREIYGEKPTELNVRLAYPEIRKVWDANFECYRKGGKIATAYSDESGVHWLWKRDNDTNEVIIRNGQAVTEEGGRVLSKPVDLNVPLYTYRDTKGNEVPVFLEPVGRLKVVIRELADIAVGFFEFRPESPTDIRNISAELASFDLFARQAGKDISGVPFILRRREEEVTARINNQLSRKQSWVVHLDLGGDWGNRAFEVIERKAIPSVIEGEAREAVQNAPDWQDTPEEWDVPPEPVIEEKAEPQPAEEHTNGKLERPLTPETLRSFIARKAAKYETAKVTISPSDRQIIAKVIDTTFNGEKTPRYELCHWLVGVSSTKDMTPAKIKTLLDWLECKSFDSVPPKYVIDEIRSAHAEALRAAGQMELGAS